MQRILQAELLDSLPPDHPDALHSRRDLRIVNRCMGNYGWFARTLPALLRPGETALELGAGDGSFGLRLAGRGIPVDGLDLWPRPPAWPAARQWHQADLRTFPGYARYPVVAGNLIFHQFNEAELAELGAVLRREARAIVACEPIRRRSSQVLLAALGPLLGANAVTRHDARVSVAAGFQGDELPRALGLRADEWNFRCNETALGAFRMVATRRA
jgi:hypothetical protein